MRISLVSLYSVAVVMACGPSTSGPGQPVKLASFTAPAGYGGIIAPGGLVVDDTHVYWTEVGSGGSDGLLFRIKKSGGEAEQLASGLDEPRHLVINDTHAYWTERDGWWRIAKTGGAVESAGVVLSTNFLREVRIDGEQLFVAYDSRVLQIDLAAPLAPVELARSLDDVGGLVVTPTHVSWLEKKPSGNLSRRARDASGAIELLVDAIPGGKALARDGETLWWAQTSGTKQVVVSAPLTGGPSTERGQFDSGAITIAADGEVFVGNVYKLLRIPPTGPAVLVADTDFISAMTLDRQNVFFATEGAPAGLFRVAR